MDDVAPRPTSQQPPRWQPISAIDRRVVGVLVEKAKTTPDQYPMSLAALRSGCNQKNNRYPLMELEGEDIEESLARLRSLGAVAEVQGGGRVSRYRHYLYEWLGVEKLELAVMTELLLRGAQTEGELRGRAARMDPIPDLGALRPVLASLKQKGLVLSLTPEGRGHMLTHALYEPRELEKVRAEAQADAPAPSADHEPAASSPRPASVSRTTQTTSASADARAFASQESVAALRGELAELRAELAELRQTLDDLRANTL